MEIKFEVETKFKMAATTNYVSGRHKPRVSPHSVFSSFYRWDVTQTIKDKKKTRGPRATIRSPEWHSHCRHADVMQHFSNPIIATNENIIIWAVLVLKKNIWAWQSMEHDHLNKLSITFQQNQCEIWWKLAKWFLKNHDFIHVNSTVAGKYYKYKSDDGHLRFPIRTILTTVDLQVTSILSI